MRKIDRSYVLTALLIAAPSLAAAQSCYEEVGPKRSQELVRQCREVSPATHPPCNANNPCELIVDEIQRGCSMLTEDVPGYCKRYR